MMAHHISASNLRTYMVRQMHVYLNREHCEWPPLALSREIYHYRVARLKCKIVVGFNIRNSRPIRSYESRS